jgi:hypothetical protein
MFFSRPFFPAVQGAPYTSKKERNAVKSGKTRWHSRVNSLSGIIKSGTMTGSAPALLAARIPFRESSTI